MPPLQKPHKFYYAIYQNVTLITNPTLEHKSHGRGGFVTARSSINVICTAGGIKCLPYQALLILLHHYPKH